MSSLRKSKVAAPDRPQVMTANLLRTGDVVYLAGDGRWVTSLGEAETVADASSRAALAQRADESLAANEVVAAYFIDVLVADGIARPVSVREAIRAQRGPSVPY